MKTILLIGLGRFGRHIAKKLIGLNHQVMAVDKDENRVNSIINLVTNAQIGDSTSSEFLSTLGVNNFDACVVAIGDDFQSSLETAYLLKEMGAKKVIARAAMELQEKFLLKNGADEVVYPEKQLAAWTAIRCTLDNILDYVVLDEDFSIFELDVPAEWNGKTVLELNLRKNFGINILGIRENGKLNMNLSSDTVINKGKSIMVLGQQKQVQKCFRI